VAQWGASFNPFTFTCYQLGSLTFTVPKTISAGQYLVRVEQIGLHVAGAPQWYVSCGQVQVTGGGSASPSKVSIPGYVSANDPGLTVNIYYPVPTAYTVPVSASTAKHFAIGDLTSYRDPPFSLVKQHCLLFLAPLIVFCSACISGSNEERNGLNSEEESVHRSKYW
jgi:hypothetical protein